MTVITVITQLRNQKEAGALRKKLIAEQDNKCAATGFDLKKPVLDHEHRKGFLLSRSGQVRGVIEFDINQLLGKIEFAAKRFNIPLDDLPFVLRKLADYLERPLLPYVHPSEKPREPIIQASNYTKLGNMILDSGDKLPEWWGYRTNNKGKPAQKLSKRLKKLYGRHGIEPAFYKS